MYLEQQSGQRIEISKAQTLSSRELKMYILMLTLESESEVAQSCPAVCNTMDCSLPGSSVHGILQARVLEWVAIGVNETY